jgi:hypothetical protein
MIAVTRVMKARRGSTCPLCKGPIRVGQLIAKCGVWAHARCAISHQHGAPGKSTGEDPAHGIAPGEAL